MQFGLEQTFDLITHSGLAVRVGIALDFSFHTTDFMFVLLNCGACGLSWMLLLTVLSIHYPQLSCLASGPCLDSSLNRDS